MRYWAEVVFAGAVSALGVGYRHLIRRAKEQKAEQDAIRRGIQALLRDRIIQAYNHYTEKGNCPIYARDNIGTLYKDYQALGGNGTVAKLVEDLEKLPTERRT